MDRGQNQDGEDDSGHGAVVLPLPTGLHRLTDVEVAMSEIESVIDKGNIKDAGLLADAVWSVRRALARMPSSAPPGPLALATVRLMCSERVLTSGAYGATVAAVVRSRARPRSHAPPKSQG